MKHIIIRHGQTPANRLNRAAYGQFGAPLNKKGIEQAQDLGRQLDALGIDKSQPVAVSDMLRAQQTAQYAGFTSLVIYPILSELKLGDNRFEALKLAAEDILTPQAAIRAQEIIANPPPELFWFSHGLVIGGLRETLSIPCSRLIPAFCEQTELYI
jgi:broad specificity phosphatase PhoE